MASPRREELHKGRLTGLGDQSVEVGRVQIHSASRGTGDGRQKGDTTQHLLPDQGMRGWGR
eukprot:scaffold1734_cov113-Isochrysis_galbana.AAC.15